MKESKKNSNNNIHLYGFINDVRINKTENGRSAINLDVATIESYKDAKGEMQNNRTFHDAVLFTEDKKILASFKKIAKDVAANNENRNVEGFKPTPHSISLDGMLVNPKGDQKSVYVLIREDSIDLDAKIAENERRNRADLTVNVDKIFLYEDKGFATIHAAHNYHPKDGKKIDPTWVDITVRSNSPYAKKAYEAIVAGEISKGDRLQVGGQIHNNNFEVSAGEGKEAEKRFQNSLSLTSFKVLNKKQVEKVEVKEEPKVEPKAAPKKKVTQKL